MAEEALKHDLPLVTVALPTYNRGPRLERALASVRAQTYQNLEILVGDNASTDETPAVARRAASLDERIRYSRAESNVGPTANFNRLLAQARGAYFMWLADDDWIDADYIAACVEQLEQSPDAISAFGYADYGGASGDSCVRARRFSLAEPQPADRCFSYYASVTDNAMFYGVTRTVALQQIGLKSGLAGDWLTMCELAAQGTMHGIPHVALHRELGGASTSHARVVEVLGLPRWHARFPSLLITSKVAWHALRLRRGGMSPWLRLRLSVCLFFVVGARQRVRYLMPRPLRKAIIRRLERRYPFEQA